MSNFTDGLRNGADYIDRGTKLAQYWLNSDKREQIQAQVKLWEKKASHMVMRYIFLWFIIIGGTIYLWLK